MDLSYARPVSADEVTHVKRAAQAGDAAGFRELVAPYQAELRAHCYRMTASMTDADDALQECLLRAWRGIEGFEGRASLRTWLYKIATHSCLDFVKERRARTVPSQVEAASSPLAPLAAPRFEPIWLEPCPETLWQVEAPGPDAQYTARESVGIAFLVALQELPPLQRAVLLARDVLGFSAADVADLLDVSVAAVNSALQRARATAEQRRAGVNHRGPDPTADPDVQRTLAEYVRAWESGDGAALVRVLHENAVMRMPPIPTWYQGREDIGRFFELMVKTLGERRVLLTVANGAPAVALYVAAEDGVLRGHSLHVLEVERGELIAVDAFLDATQLERFALPDTLP